MKVIGVIPARFNSSRFEGKILVPLLGKPMVIHVAEKLVKALGKDNTLIATDDQRIAEVVDKYGFRYCMTSNNHPTGTDRVCEVAQKISADIYVNVQGDEPMVDPIDISKIVETKLRYPDHVINGMCPISSDEDPENINLPKVLVNSNNELIYMSRLPIPGQKNKNSANTILAKQVCIYAFNYRELNSFGTAQRPKYELLEDIEILRFLDLGVKIKMVETSGNSLAVDTPDDVPTVEKAMKILLEES